MKWFRNLKLARKISFLSLVFILFMLGIGFLGITSLHSNNKDFQSLNNDRLIPMHDLEEAKANLINIQLDVKSHLTTVDGNVKKQLEDDILKYEKEYDSLIKKYAATYLVESEKKGLDELRAAYSEYKASKDTTIKLSIEQKLKEAMDNSNDNDAPKYERVMKAFNNLVDIQIVVAEELYKENISAYNRVTVEFLGILIVSIILGTILTMMISHAVVSPVKAVTLKLKEISENGGDLRQRIGLTTRDEIGLLSNAFDRFMDKLQSMIRDVMDSAQIIAASTEQLATATNETNIAMEQISQTVNGVASGTVENMAVVEQTTAGLIEAARYSEATALASKKTSENSINVKTSAEKSANQINGIVDSMNSIAKSSEEVALTINDLGESSHQIGEMVGVITAISEQTNLLALNAAIEAARAGEAGKGFKVVADEIRRLADGSNQSAEEIAAIVRDNQAKVDKTILSVKEVDEMVAVGVKRASKVKTHMDNIINNIVEIVDQITDIDKAVTKQAEVTDEITKGMHNIADNANEMTAATQEMSASVEEQVSTMEEIEATTQHIAQMAQQLNEITMGFQV